MNSEIKHIGFLILWFVFCLLAGCTRSQLNTKEYSKFILDPDNGLIVKTTVNDVQFSAQYQPIDFLALMEQQGVKDQMKFDQTKNKYGKLNYFKFSVVLEGGKDLISANSGDSLMNKKALQYFYFDMAKNISLINGADTCHPVLFSYDRNYGTSPINDFSIAFDSKSALSDKINFIYQDEFFNCGKISLNFDGTKLRKIPELIL